MICGVELGGSIAADRECEGFERDEHAWGWLYFEPDDPDAENSPLQNVSPMG